jgi:uncharacterized protein
MATSHPNDCMYRRKFLKQTAYLSIGTAFLPARPGFGMAPISNRPPIGERRFSSTAVDAAITRFKTDVRDKELAELFENCFPNTLDTTVEFSMIDGRPDTYVITGDIDAMWLRDSTAQVWPYLSLIKDDKNLQQLIGGVINRQTRNILFDPYANAFYKESTKVSEWKDDVTDMKPGIHERKWEIDSLCYPVRLAYGYWKATGDQKPFDHAWLEASRLIVQTFREQQRKSSQGPYKFERRTTWATDGVALGGYGYPTKKVGLIHSMFRPSDDATIFPYLIPSNYFAAHSLRQLAEMVSKISHDQALANAVTSLAMEVETALASYAFTQHPSYGKILAYETNALGSYNLMDDANVPSLLSLPYLGIFKKNDPVYLTTRKFLLSEANPFFFKGTAGEGIGGPHAGVDMIWPLSIIIRALTSDNNTEISQCIRMLKNSSAGTGFMHESFHKNDASKFSRKWFAWANTIFGELLWTTYLRDKSVLSTKV